MSTINEQNARQIRDPMQIEISMQVGSSAKISNYTVPSTYKSYDNTLGNAEYSMRVLADLAGDGFPLDGTVELYDPNKTPSADNGKLGFRGNVGQNVSVTITATNNLSSVSVKANGIVSITCNGTTYPAAALNIIPIGARTATLVFNCEDNNERVEIDYIVPGVALYIDNDNLVQCTLALRGNLDVANHSWEESEIEIQAYYPYDISDSFKYVMNEWPITYRAGYDADMSEVRRFYLSEPVTMVDNVITIKGVDASHRLNDKTMPEQWLDVRKSNAHQVIYAKFIDAIKSTGITIQRQQSWSGTASGAFQHAILPEMTVRDFVAGTMNLTLNHTNGSNKYGIQFVDAGIPTIEHGDGKTYGQTWTIFKSDCGDFNEQFERNIAKVQDSNDERKFNEIIAISSEVNVIGGDTKILNLYSADEKPEDLYTKNQEIELNFDGYYYNVRDFRNTASSIFISPSRAVFKAKNNSVWEKNQSSLLSFYHIKNGKTFVGSPVAITGGQTAYTNPNGLPGQTIEMEPFVYGALLDANGATVFNYPSLFNRSTRTGSFVWKGDPRMQPLDYLVIVNDTNDGRDTITARATSIELTHEGGGTTATINWREWDMDISGTVLADEHGAALIDNNGDFLSAE